MLSGEDISTGCLKSKVGVKKMKGWPNSDIFGCWSLAGLATADNFIIFTSLFMESLNGPGLVNFLEAKLGP